MTEHYYGEPPTEMAQLDLSQKWTEFMHYLYLPVRIPVTDGDHLLHGDSITGRLLGHADWDADQEVVALWAIPDRLAFLEDAARACFVNAMEYAPHLSNPYVYITARRGFATPGNPLNRPGWHCDDFGGTDLNYTWCDRFPTRYLTAPKGLIDMSTDDAESMVQMKNLYDNYVYHPTSPIALRHVPLNTIMRLSPYVIHDTPLIYEGGMRSFFKISVSTHRYNLIGNSRNHLLNYDWPMVSRDEMRNQPSGGNRDYYERENNHA